MTFTGWSSVATMGSVYYVAMIGLGVYQAYIKRCKLRIKEEKLELLRQRDAAAEGMSYIKQSICP